MTCSVCAGDTTSATALVTGSEPSTTFITTPAGSPVGLPHPVVDVAESPGIEIGVAGASARREHERRKATREARIRTAHPRIGGFVLALSDNPQSTTAWAVGARGEELLAKSLDGLADQGVLTLHDRRIPGTRANIDHIAIAAGRASTSSTPSGTRGVPACTWKEVCSGPAPSGCSSAVVTAQNWSPASISR